MKEEKILSKKTTNFWWLVILSTTIISVIFMTITCIFVHGMADDDEEPRIIYSNQSIENQTDTVSALRPFVDYSVDPCDDFYEHACGLWMKNQSKDRKITRVEELQKEHDNSLKNLLFSKVSSTIIYYEGLLNFTKACAGKKENKYFLTIFGHEIHHHLFFHKPIINSNDIRDFPFKATLWEVSAMDFNVFFTFSVNGTNKPYIEISSGMPYFMTEVDNKAKYKHIESPLNHAIDEMMKSLFSRSGQPWSSPKREQIADIVNFEMSWYEALMDVKPDNHSKTSDRPRNQRVLSLLPTKPVNWDEFVQNLYELKDVHNWTVLSQDEARIVATAKLIKDTPEHVLRNYLFYRFVFHFGPLVDPQLYHVILDLHDKLRKAGVSKRRAPSLVNNCFRATKHYFNEILASFHTDQHYKEKEKKFFKRVVKTMKETFTMRMKANTYLDETSKQKIVEKIEKTEIIYGYSQDIDNPEYLTIDINSTDVLVLERGKRRHHKNKMRLKNSNFSPKTHVDTDMFTLGSTYYESHDILVVHLPLLSLYDPSTDNFINYGTVGGFLAKQMVKILGIPYDKEGSISWMTADDLEEMKFRNKCVKINEEITKMMREDNEAVKLSFFSYQHDEKVSNEKERFPTQIREKMNFLAYAQYFCVNTGDNSAPERLNFPLSGFSKFSEVFHCGHDSNMTKPVCDILV